MEELIKKNRLKSVDDEPKNFKFKSFERAMTQMDCANTSIGGILSAMIYQVEADNSAAKPTGLFGSPRNNAHGCGDEISVQHGISELNRTDCLSDTTAPDNNNRDKLAAQLDDMFNSLAIEQGVV